MACRGTLLVLLATVTLSATELGSGLRQADLTQRFAAAQALAELGPAAAPAAEALAQCLADDYHDVRLAASDALAAIGPAALPVLSRCLAAGDYWTVGCAARSCGLMGPPAAPALPQLLEVLQRRSVDQQCQLQALWALSRIGDAAPDMLPVLFDPQPTWRHSRSYYEALAAHGAAARPAVPVLLQERVREPARTALEQIVEEAALDRLLWSLRREEDLRPLDLVIGPVAAVALPTALSAPPLSGTSPGAWRCAVLPRDDRERIVRLREALLAAEAGALLATTPLPPAAAGEVDLRPALAGRQRCAVFLLAPLRLAEEQTLGLRLRTPESRCWLSGQAVTTGAVLRLAAGSHLLLVELSIDRLPPVGLPAIRPELRPRPHLFELMSLDPQRLQVWQSQYLRGDWPGGMAVDAPGD